MESSNIPGRKKNPVLDPTIFQGLDRQAAGDVMTVSGAVNRTGILLTIVVVSAAAAWQLMSSRGAPDSVYFWLMLTPLAAFIVALITNAFVRYSPYTAPLYAFLEGCTLGLLSGIVDIWYPGIVIQAVFLTFGTLFGLLVVYRVSGFQVTSKFRAGVLSMMLGVLVLYLVEFAAYLFGLQVQFLHQSGLIGIAVSLFVIVIAALNLVLDFDIIESGAREHAPRYFEWYAAFGLMVTLIWLYLEILELLLIASDDDA